MYLLQAVTTRCRRGVQRWRTRPARPRARESESVPPPTARVNMKHVHDAAGGALEGASTRVPVRHGRLLVSTLHQTKR